jgi:hypothetical protein
LACGDDSSGNREIYYKTSTNGGTTWTAADRLTWNSGVSWDPALAADSSGDLHLVWWDDTVDNREIYYKKSTDSGATWTPGKRLTWTEGTSQSPFIVVDSSGHLHVAWEDYTPGNSEIYYKKSTNGGATWTASQRLTWSGGYCRSPVIGIDSSDLLHLVWDIDLGADEEIYYKKSLNGGSTWTASQRLTWTVGDSYGAKLAVDSSNALHVVWSDETHGAAEIYYKKSTNGGAAWTTSQRLTWTTGTSNAPSLAVDSIGTVHIVWWDTTPGNGEIYYKKDNRETG